MVARLIHRYGVADVAFPGARFAQLDGVDVGDTVMFGLHAVDRVTAMSSPDGGASARAIRDAAHLEMSSCVGQIDRHRDNAPAQLVDLGDLRVESPDAARSVAGAAAQIAGRGGRPVLLGGGVDEAAALIGGISGPDGGLSGPVVLISPKLDLGSRFAAASLPRPWLAIGTHDLLSRSTYVAWTERGGIVLTAYALATAGQGAIDAALAPIARPGAPAVVILDMTCVDTGYAAGAIGANIGGVDPAGFVMAAERVGAALRVAGLAVINLAPERDPRGHTERIAAQALLRLVCPSATAAN
jgi:arginase family enzyme